MSYSISAAMIVRDGEATLSRALESVQGLVDEIVVVDTGSTDRTVAIAEEHGAKVFHFDWIDDFSAARNHSLDQATGDWRLVLDADEWLDDTARPALERERSLEPTFVGWAECVSLTGDEKAPGTVRSRACRLMPRGARWSGRIHEQPTGPFPNVEIDLVLHHDGYLDSRTAGKGERNRRLLTKALEEDPSNPYLLYQLGKDIGFNVSSELAVDTLALAMRLAPAGVVWREDAISHWVQNLLALGRDDEARAVREAHAAEISVAVPGEEH